MFTVMGSEKEKIIEWKNKDNSGIKRKRQKILRGLVYDLHPLDKVQRDILLLLLNRWIYNTDDPYL